MSFLREYKSYLSVLHFFGLCPFSVNNRKGQVRYSTSSCLYNSSIFVATTLLSGRYIYSYMKYFIEYKQFSIQLLASSVQLATTVAFNAAIQCYFLKKRHSHGMFLNEIVAFDRQFEAIYLSASCNWPRKSNKTRKHFRENISLTILYCALLIYADYSVRNENYVMSERQVLYYVYCFSVSGLYAMAMHFRSLASALHIRCYNICKIFEISSCVEAAGGGDALKLLDQMWSLKRQFEKLFGLFVLITAVIDLTTTIVVVFICINYVTWKVFSIRLWSYLTLICGFMIWPMLKFRLVSVAGHSFGQQLERVQLVLSTRIARSDTSNLVRQLVSLLLFS